MQGNMPQNSGPYLIIAQSGRALAASACAAGIQTHVIDRFADTDTEKYALSTRVVNGNESGISVDHLRSFIDEYKQEQIQGVVTGSGFENQPEVLNELDDQFTLLGNTSECVKNCKDPALFFPLLESQGIPYPEINLHSINQQQGWLVKKTGGTGGRHIYRADGNKLPHKHYYQKYIKGHTISVTFLANGRDIKVIGFNEVWTKNTDRNFAFAVAITQPDIKSTVKNRLKEIIKLLTEQLNLYGLCGLDVIVDQNNNIFVLEINPRPVATFELHDKNGYLFHAHIEACKGNLPKIEKLNDDESKGLEIKYLMHDFIVPEISWPDWVTDRPVKGLKIASGEPICTIHAAAPSLQETRDLLDQRKAKINKLLGLEKIAA